MHSDTDFAIRLEGVSKRYSLNPDTPLSVSDIVLHPRTLVRQILGREPFWALQDISLDVKRGEVLGVMGANGTGKSTLLRVMVGLSEPTTGTVAINGTFAALMELGAGFHPRATGRENAYINALFMGLSKREAKEKIPEIIEFAGLEAFADQPLRTYSSGMQLRLGFAVAVHTKPQILLIDEVLAVGDAEFQQKCFDHFGTLKERGATIVLVSHNMVVIREFTDRVVLMDKGRLVREGDPKTIVDEYLTRRIRESPIVRRQFARALRMQGIIDDDEGDGEPASATSGKRSVD